MALSTSLSTSTSHDTPHTSRRRKAAAFAGIVLAGTVGFGSIAAAAGTGSDEGGNTGRRAAQVAQLTDDQKCEKADDLIARVNGLQEKLASFEARLTELKAKAEAAGRERLVAKIDERLERLNTISEKIAARLAEFQTWVGEHCD